MRPIWIAFHGRQSLFLEAPPRDLPHLSAGYSGHPHLLPRSTDSCVLCPVFILSFPQFELELALTAERICYAGSPEMTTTSSRSSGCFCLKGGRLGPTVPQQKGIRPIMRSFPRRRQLEDFEQGNVLGPMNDTPEGDPAASQTHSDVTTDPKARLPRLYRVLFCTSF